jgi:hypothetical protein
MKGKNLSGTIRAHSNDSNQQLFICFSSQDVMQQTNKFHSCVIPPLKSRRIHKIKEGEYECPSISVTY